MSRNVRSGLISKRGPSRTASHVIRSSETTATDCPSRNCGEAQRSSPHTGSGATWEASHCRKGLSSQSQFTGLPTQGRNFIKAQHLSFCHVGIWKEAVVAKFQAFLDSNYRNWRVYKNSYCRTWVKGGGGCWSHRCCYCHQRSCIVKGILCGKEQVHGLLNVFPR